MITLYGWGPMFDCPSPSPYVMKTDMQLQMLGIDFKRAIADLDAVPKHKAPYVYDGDTLVQDSNFIRACFEKRLGRSLDDGLSAQETDASWALERMAEGHLSDCMLYERWMKDENFFKGPAQFFMDVPEPARAGVMSEIRTQMKATEEAAGFGRHSEKERLQLADWDIRAIALQLGDKDYLFGSSPVAADARVRYAQPAHLVIAYARV